MSLIPFAPFASKQPPPHQSNGIYHRCIYMYHGLRQVARELQTA